MAYNDKLDPDEQIDTEELIASIIENAQTIDHNNEYNGLEEDECAMLGRKILARILSRFRPDLVADDVWDFDNSGVPQ